MGKWLWPSAQYYHRTDHRTEENNQNEISVYTAKFLIKLLTRHPTNTSRSAIHAIITSDPKTFQNQGDHLVKNKPQNYVYINFLGKGKVTTIF
jgi:hypothetical protein